MPQDERPKKTQSLRLLIRCLCARWRAASKSPDEQYVGVDGSWWGEGDAAADEVEDIDDLVEPPPEADEEAGDDMGGGEREEEEGHLGGLCLDDALLDMAKQARYYLDSEMRVSHEYAASMMGRLCCNSLTIYSREPGDARREVGLALSASVAMFNHDCEPSADWGLDASGGLFVRTTRDLRAGDEICLSYVDLQLPVEARRRKLKRLFFFDCRCARCTRELAAIAAAGAGSRSSQGANKRKREKKTR